MLVTVVELEPGQEPPETPYILIVVDRSRQHTWHGIYSYGSVRFTPDDPEQIRREIMNAEDQAKELGFTTVYLQRNPALKVGDRVQRKPAIGNPDILVIQKLSTDQRVATCALAQAPRITEDILLSELVPAPPGRDDWQR